MLRTPTPAPGEWQGPQMPCPVQGTPCQHPALGASAPFCGVEWGALVLGRKGLGKAIREQGSHLVFLDIRGLWVTAHVDVTRCRVGRAGHVHAEHKGSVPTGEVSALLSWSQDLEWELSLVLNSVPWT